MSDGINQDGSPMGSRNLFRVQGAGPAANWLTNTMRVHQDTPTAFRDIVNRALDGELANNKAFWQMMDAEAAAIAQRGVSAAGNRRVRIMMPDEARAAESLTGLRGGGAPPETEDSPVIEDRSPPNRLTNGGEQALPSVTPTLIEGLKHLSKKQAEDLDIMADMAIQGASKPSNYEPFREHAVLQEELFVVVAMMDGTFVQPLHLFIKYSSTRRRACQYNGEYLAANGDRVGLADPPYVVILRMEK